MLKASQRRKLPIQGALYCMKKLATKLSLVGEHKIKNQWFKFDGKENSVLISLYRIIHEGCTSKCSEVSSACKAYKEGFIKVIFPSGFFYPSKVVVSSELKLLPTSTFNVL